MSSPTPPDQSKASFKLGWGSSEPDLGFSQGLNILKDGASTMSVGPSSSG